MDIWIDLGQAARRFQHGTGHRCPNVHVLNVLSVPTGRETQVVSAPGGAIEGVIKQFIRNDQQKRGKL